MTTHSNQSTEQSEFPASKLILTGFVWDRGQLSPTQRADLDKMVEGGEAVKTVSLDGTPMWVAKYFAA